MSFYAHELLSKRSPLRLFWQASFSEARRGRREVEGSGARIAVVRRCLVLLLRSCSTAQGRPSQFWLPTSPVTPPAAQSCDALRELLDGTSDWQHVHDALQLPAAKRRRKAAVGGAAAEGAEGEQLAGGGKACRLHAAARACSRAPCMDDHSTHAHTHAFGQISLA